MQIQIQKLEKSMGVPIKRNLKCLGVDTASRTGWCSISTRQKTAKIEYGFVSIESKSLDFKYDRMINIFDSLLKENYDLIIIEDVFFGKSIHVVKMLSRIGMIVYVLACLKNIKRTWLLATQARKGIGINSRLKKKEVHKIFNKRFKFGTKDEDAIDAIILALNGVIDK